VAARSGEWAQHFSNASCFNNCSYFTLNGLSVWWMHFSLFNLIVHLLMKSDHRTLKLLQFLLNCAGLRVGKYLLFCALFLFYFIPDPYTWICHLTDNDIYILHVNDELM